jgi:hypothetical protein
MKFKKIMILENEITIYKDDIGFYHAFTANKDFYWWGSDDLQECILSLQDEPSETESDELDEWIFED